MNIKDIIFYVFLILLCIALPYWAGYVGIVYLVITAKGEEALIYALLHDGIFNINGGSPFIEYMPIGIIVWGLLYALFYILRKQLSIYA